MITARWCFCLLLAVMGAGAAQAMQAVRLEATYRFETDGSGEIRKFMLWKTQTAADVKAASQFHLPFQGSFESLRVVGFRTRKANGQTVEGDLSQVVESAAPQPPGVSVYQDQRIRTVLMPNVEVGDSVELEFVKSIRRHVKENEFWEVHLLTKTAQVTSEAVTLDLPKGRKVSFAAAQPPATEERGNRVVHRWQTSNPEALAPSQATVTGSVLFAVSTFASWDAVGEWVRGLNEPRQQVTEAVRELATKLTAGAKSDEEKILALYSYVAQKIRYTSVSFGVGMVQPHAAADVLRNSYGDCKDKHALFAALLMAVGIESMAVLTTPGAGVPRADVPMPSFSHEFTAIRTKAGVRYLDTTLELARPEVLMPGVRGQQALLIEAANARLLEIPVQSPVLERSAGEFTGTLAASGRLEGKRRMEISGQLEPLLRRVFRDGSREQQEKFVLQLTGLDVTSPSVSGIRTTEPGDLSQPFAAEFTLVDARFVDEKASQKRINLSAGLPESIDQMLAQKVPAKPVAVERREISRKIELQVDSSFSISESKEAAYRTEFGSYASRPSFADGKLRVERTIVFDAITLTAENWPRYVNFLRQVRGDVTRTFTLERGGGAPSLSAGKGSTQVQQLMDAASRDFQKRDFVAAITSLEEVVKLEPRHASAWSGLAAAHLGRNHSDKALEAVQRQLEINPRHEGAYYVMGAIYQRQKKNGEAIAAYRKQLEVTPKHNFAPHSLLAVLMEERQWQAAYEASLLAAKTARVSSVQWRQIGRAQALAGRTEEARASLEASLKESAGPSTSNGVAYVMAETGLDLERAAQLAGEALQREAGAVCQPDHVSADPKCYVGWSSLASTLDTAGWVAYKRKRYGEAVAYLDAAYAIRPEAVIGFHLAAARVANGDITGGLWVLSGVDLAKRTDVDKDAVMKAMEQAAGADKVAASQSGKRAAPGQLAPVTGLPELTGNNLGTWLILAAADGSIRDVRKPDGSAAPPAVAAYAKKLKLLAVKWEGAALATVRELSLRGQGDVRSWTIPIPNQGGQ